MCEVFLVYVRVSDWPFYFRIMLKAIEDVLNDESIHIPLEPAAMAFKQVPVDRSRSPAHGWNSISSGKRRALRKDIH